MRWTWLLLAAVLAGCGGSNGGNKESYVKAGNAICADYQVAIAKLGQPTTLGEIGPYITKALPVLTKTVAELGHLNPPDDQTDFIGTIKDWLGRLKSRNDLSGAYAKFIDAARQAAGRATALRDAASKSDATEVQRLLKEAAAASKSRIPLARAAGLETCAKI